MRILVLGAAADVRGFALAGVDGRVVSDAESARRELARERAAGGEEIGLLLVSEFLARDLPVDLAGLAAAGPPPAILVLPETAR